MTQKAYAYLCTKGHVDAAPSMGTYARCQYLVDVRTPTGLTGRCPCNEPIVSVLDADGVLEAAFRVGGPTAVLQVVKERLADAGPSAERGNPPR